MEKKTNILSEQALLLEKIQKQSLSQEKNKIKKWSKKLVEMDIEVIQQANKKFPIESQEVLDQITESIFQDIIKK